MRAFRTALGAIVAVGAGATVVVASAGAGPTTEVAATTPTTPPVAFDSLSVAGGRTAVLRRTGNRGFEMLVGRGVDVTAVPGFPPLRRSQVEYVDGVGYAGVHAGTDANGRPVLIYPRCRLVQRRPYKRESCDLYVFDLDAKRERLIPGVRRRDRSETEGVMERGALAYAASSSKAAESGLWLRSADGRQRRVALNPGRDLALHGRQIASVVVDGVKENGEEPCENRTLVLRSVGAKPRVIARDCIDTYTQTLGWTTPRFLDGALYWGSDTLAGPALFRSDLRTRKVEQASVTGGRVHGFQATSPTSGIAAVQTEGAATVDDRGVADKLVALDDIAWTPRIRSIIKTIGDTNPAALR